jgi:hypothetical protein
MQSPHIALVRRVRYLGLVFQTLPTARPQFESLAYVRAQKAIRQNLWLSDECL